MLEAPIFDALVVELGAPEPPIPAPAAFVLPAPLCGSLYLSKEDTQ